MRALVLVAALAAAACSAETNVATESADGYTLEVRSDDIAQIFLVTAPDGRVAAGRATDGASALLNRDDTRDVAAIPPPTAPAGEPEVSIRVPGFSLEVADDEKAGANDDAHVAMTFGGGGSLTVDAQREGEQGRAHVRITGASEATARDFINDADGLSPEVKTEMLAAVGLE